MIVSVRTAILAIVVSALAPAGIAAQGKQAPQGDVDPGIVVVTQFLEAYNNHSVDDMLALADSGISWLSVAADQISTEARGREELRAAMVAHFTASPDAHSDFLSIEALGRFVTTHERARSRRPTGDSFQSSVAVYELRGGKILRVWYFPVVRGQG